MLVGHNLDVVLSQGRGSVLSEGESTLNANTDGSSAPASNLDLLHVVLRAAGIAGRGVTSILVLLDLQVVLSGDGSCICAKGRSKLPTHADCQSLVIPNHNGIIVCVGRSRELEGTSLSFKDSLTEDIYTAVSNDCALGHNRSRKSGHCHSQHKEYCYSFDSLTP